MTPPTDELKDRITDVLKSLYDQLHETHFCVGPANDSNLLRGAVRQPIQPREKSASSSKNPFFTNFERIYIASLWNASLKLNWSIPSVTNIILIKLD